MTLPRNLVVLEPFFQSIILGVTRESHSYTIYFLTMKTFQGAQRMWVLLATTKPSPNIHNLISTKSDQLKF